MVCFYRGCAKRLQNSLSRILDLVSKKKKKEKKTQKIDSLRLVRRHYIIVIIRISYIKSPILIYINSSSIYSTNFVN